MKNYDEYMEHIRSKAKNIKSRRRIMAASCSAMLVLVLALTLFVPYNSQLPNVDRYKDSPYYKLIPGINKVTYQPPEYKNNYEWLKDVLSGVRGSSTDVMDAPTAAIPGTMDTITGGPIYGAEADTSINTSGTASPSLKDDQYQETTDNQVQGVIESDLFKRSDKYLYYLRGSTLSVYSIDKENSAEIAAFKLPLEENVYYNHSEMFLSKDCTTLTILSQQSVEGKGACTVIYSLDVTDPVNIQSQEPVYFFGNYITSRMVDGQLLLIYNYRIDGQIDFDKPETFVPQYGPYGNVMPIGAENIYCPVEEPNSACYTVIAMMDSKTLTVQDTAALLSYSGPIYVSETAIYATYSCDQRAENEETILQTAYTEITGISYTGDELDILGTVTLEGSVKDQYSMDEYNGVLRVATTTSVVTLENSHNDFWWVVLDRKFNCNLYCIDLSTWEVASSVIAFAPEGEEVTSARFDGSMGYICTAEVIVMTDPVYFFDLSDIHNITYKHTPVIDGFSSSLINFGDYLLGIGYNEKRELKVEVYEETADGVWPVTSYERPAFFSEQYKSYYIDRENNIVGLGIEDRRTGQEHYLLLHFDGYELVVLQQLSMKNGYVRLCRADIIDGYLYLLEDQLQVVKVY
jgi:uncharacterized secreted protein with C-terminal beta-propeller domain